MEQIRTTYTSAVKECIKRYRVQNKAKINEKNREYYHKKMQNPEYKQKLRERAIARYQQKIKDKKIEKINNTA